MSEVGSQFFDVVPLPTAQHKEQDGGQKDATSENEANPRRRPP
jgi:hypothetical protein